MEINNMFRENNSHLQNSFLTSETWMNPAVVKRLMKSWAVVFYNAVFCKISESIFSKLYCQDNGRPNFPVNILLALEYIKCLFDYSDAELVEQFYFNYQISYAVGIKNVGEINLSPGTLYEFRRKIYKYAAENPTEGDLLFKQFIELTKEFAEQSDVITNEQRMDSTMISANIKNAGRLALAYDVLEQAIKLMPEELMTESMKEILDDGYKSKLLYKSKSNQVINRLKELLAIGETVLIVSSNSLGMPDLSAIKLLKRFIDEQTDTVLETGKRTVKSNKEIKANSLQSAYDEDATYRKKAKKQGKGYVVNLAETCNEDNDVQFITDYDVDSNIASDTEFAKKRIPKIKSNFELTDMYVDGGYFSSAVEEVSQSIDVTMHYTDMTGKRTNEELIPINKFELNEDKTVKQCPGGYKPQDTKYNPENDTINAHFAKEVCDKCEFKDKCCIIEQVKANKFSATGIEMELQNMRDEIKEDRKENTSKRTAIEGTNSELKRAHGLDSVKVLGIVKVKITTGLKIMACNIKRFAKNALKKLTPKPVLQNIIKKPRDICANFS